MTRKLLLILAITAMSLTTAACNTVKGLGKDIQSVGQAGEEVID